MAELSREEYARRYGPTTGDRVRLGDTDLWIRVEDDHVGYGAGGPHFCLGANLARREIMMAFRELHEQVPDIRSCGEPAMLSSMFIHGIKRMPCSFTPGGAR